MNLRNLLSAHHLPEDDGGAGGGGGGTSIGMAEKPINTAGRLHIQEAPSAFAKIYQAYAPHHPNMPDTPYANDNARQNAAINSIFRSVREASSGSGVDEARARHNIANNVLKNLGGYDSAKLKPSDLQSTVDYLYKNRNYIVDESGNLLPWQNAQDDVRVRQNRKEGIIHAAPEKPAEGTGVNTEHRGKQVLQY